jgi:energy-coupling factor transporter ATP-binding protein EcfA2
MEKMKAKHLQELVKICITHKENLLIVGAPGTGKTQIVEQVANDYCAEHGGEYMILHPVCDDPADWKGLGFPSIDRTQAHFLPFGNLLTMTQATKNLIVIIDDVGQSMDTVQAAIMQTIEQREINGNKISEFVRFILCSNRRGDKAAVRGIIEPLKSRCMIVTLDVSDDDWRVWANGAGMPPELIAFSKLRPQLLHDFQPSTDMTNSACPRGWARVGRAQLAGMPRVIEFESYQGCVGEKAAAEYTTFLRIYREMPDPEDYLKDPNKELPTNESTLYALTAALAAMANSKNVKQVFNMAMRLEGEYSTFMVFSMVQRDKKLAQTKEMSEWAKKYAAYLL